MTEAITNLFLRLHETIGASGYGIFSAIVTAALCILIIPRTTDLMVDSAAGLAGKYLGNEKRTMVINLSTNTPEFFSMIVAFFMLRLGGIGNPLGSNLANLYLMFLLAPLWVVLLWKIKGEGEKVSAFFALVKKEKKLVLWHVLAGLMLYLLATFTLWVTTGEDKLGGIFGGNVNQVGKIWLMSGALLCTGAVFFFLAAEVRLKKDRRELFSDIDDEGQNPSWMGLFVGMAGLIIACSVMNALFVSWENVYSTFLTGILGAAVFTGLQYFLGALVTSLPEMTVATRNFRRLSSPDLNTALGSASYSNMSNVGIAGIGALIAWILTCLGFNLIP